MVDEINKVQAAKVFVSEAYIKTAESFAPETKRISEAFKATNPQEYASKVDADKAYREACEKNCPTEWYQRKLINTIKSALFYTLYYEGRKTAQVNGISITNAEEAIRAYSQHGKQAGDIKVKRVEEKTAQVAEEAMRVEEIQVRN